MTETPTISIVHPGTDNGELALEERQATATAEAVGKTREVAEVPLKERACMYEACSGRPLKEKSDAAILKIPPSTSTIEATWDDTAAEEDTAADAGIEAEAEAEAEVEAFEVLLLPAGASREPELREKLQALMTTVALDALTESAPAG